MNISYLPSGGLIVNYRCPASCGHCMYGSSPSAEPGYMAKDVCEYICKKLYSMNCRGLHIGGGEPFLNIDGLVDAIKIIKKSGIPLDYIETNGAWVTDDINKNIDILSRVASAGGDTIMVSADPFHLSFIPPKKPKILVGLLQKMGFSYFIWQERYWKMLLALDENKVYTPNELHKALGYDIYDKCAREYGMGFNGRALNLLRNFPQTEFKNADAFISKHPCRELSNTSHFHVDYLKRYVVPGCTGMGVLLEDLGQPLCNKKYPVMSRLQEGGTAGLLGYAESLGYDSRDRYASRCDLCFKARKYLAVNEPGSHPDLTPGAYYRQDY